MQFLGIVDSPDDWSANRLWPVHSHKRIKERTLVVLKKFRMLYDLISSSLKSLFLYIIKLSIMVDLFFRFFEIFG